MLTYRALIAALLVLVTACFLRGRGFARGVTSSSEIWSVASLRFPRAIVDCVLCDLRGEVFKGVAAV